MDMPKTNLTVRDFIVILKALEGVKLKLINEADILDENQIPHRMTEIDTIEELIEKIKNITT